MEILELAPNGPALFIPKVFGDNRGYFMETFRQNEFEEHCGKYTFVQDNQSKSTKNVLRGLHYQLEHSQGKLVRVIKGEVYDVAVDLRQSSPTFGKCFAATLSEANRHSLWVPPGFAHGFFVCSDDAEFVYKCTSYYDPSDEHCLLWNDPCLHLEWPLNGNDPILSEKDKKGLPFSECAKYL